MRPSVTFDFDDTLATFDSPPKSIDQNIKYLKQIAQLGFPVYVVTFRSADQAPQVKSFIRVHNLPVHEVYTTNMHPKINILKKLNSVMHVDDDPGTLTQCRTAGIYCVDALESAHSTNVWGKALKYLSRYEN